MKGPWRNPGWHGIGILRYAMTHRSFLTVAVTLALGLPGLVFSQADQTKAVATPPENRAIEKLVRLVADMPSSCLAQNDYEPLPEISVSVRNSLDPFWAPIVPLVNARWFRPVLRLPKGVSHSFRILSVGMQLRDKKVPSNLYSARCRAIFGTFVIPEEEGPAYGLQLRDCSIRDADGKKAKLSCPDHIFGDTDGLVRELN